MLGSLSNCSQCVDRDVVFDPVVAFVKIKACVSARGSELMMTKSTRLCSKREQMASC